MSREPHRITGRWVTMAIRGILNAGVDLRTVRVDPTTGAVAADIVSDTNGDATDDVSTLLARRIEKRERARPVVGKPGADATSRKAKPTKDRTS
jgi:hypothetical protein